MDLVLAFAGVGERFGSASLKISDDRVIWRDERGCFGSWEWNRVSCVVRVRIGIRIGTLRISDV
jgi:DNA/RNA-binding domain of Phe-tRNA-synthetase-like protein